MRNILYIFNAYISLPSLIRYILFTSFIVSYPALASFLKNSFRPVVSFPLWKIFGVGLVLRNAAVNLLGELKPDSCVNRVKTSRHHLVHESWEKQAGSGPLLSCPALKVTWQLTSDRAACPRPYFSTCLSLCHFTLPLHFSAYPLLLFEVVCFHFHVAAFGAYFPCILAQANRDSEADRHL